jgi:hypothetical protein
LIKLFAIAVGIWEAKKVIELSGRFNKPEMKPSLTLLASSTSNGPLMKNGCFHGLIFYGNNVCLRDNIVFKPSYFFLLRNLSINKPLPIFSVKYEKGAVNMLVNRIL